MYKFLALITKDQKIEAEDVWYYGDVEEGVIYLHEGDVVEIHYDEKSAIEFECIDYLVKSNYPTEDFWYFIDEDDFDKITEPILVFGSETGGNF